MLFGVESSNVAVPPSSLKTKSSFSKEPLPPVLLKTGLLNFTFTALLSFSIVTLAKVGAV